MSTETTAGADVRPYAHPTITELLARAMADITHVGKDGVNKQQNFNFRGIDAVLNAVGPAFRAHGIVPKPILKDVAYENITVGEKRTPMTRCTVRVKYRFMGPGGDFEDVTVPGEAFDSGDKGTAKAMSVAYRIALIQLLALPTNEPDPDESSYERAPAAVTDQRWLAAVRQRIAGATDHDALNVIGADIGAQADAGQLGMADGNRLRAEFDARWTALTRATPDGNGWDSPSQERPAERHHGPVADEWNLPPTPVATTAPAPTVGTPNNPGITAPQQKAMHALLNKAGYGNREKGLALLARYVGHPLESSSQLSKTEAKAVIDKLSNGELPSPESEPVGPDALGEGISEFDVLDQMILDVTSDEASAEVEQAISVEFGGGTITATGAGVLRQRLAAHLAGQKALT